MVSRDGCPGMPSLKDLIDGRLSDTEEKDVVRHIEHCTKCQLAVEQLAPAREELCPRGATGAELLLEAREQALKEAMIKLHRRECTDSESLTQQLSDTEYLRQFAPSKSADSLGSLGPYEITGVIGRGGMGTVFKALDTSLDRIVAVKVLSPSLASKGTARKRFVREARSAAAVVHDHVITIHAVDDAADEPYLVMQFVSGMSLQEKIDRNGPLEVKEILRIAQQIAGGLSAAHHQGLVHRDITPSNILLENGIERVKITDFGLARAVDDSSVTHGEVIAGTPQYMAPEQASGDPVDHRADLFSLGSVMYTMCTGYPPFREHSTVATLRSVCDKNPRSIRELNPEIPQALEDVVALLHEKDPANRPQSAGEVESMLADQLSRAQRPTTGFAGDVRGAAVRDVKQRPTGIARSQLGRAILLGGAMLLLGVVAAESTGVTRVARFLASALKSSPNGVTGQALSDAGPDTFDMFCVDAQGIPVTGAEVHLFQRSDGTDGRYIHFGPFISDEQGKVDCREEFIDSKLRTFDRWVYARVPGRLVGVARSAKWKNSEPINPKFRVQLQASRSVAGLVSVPDGFDPSDVTVQIRTLHVVVGRSPMEFESFPREERFPGLDSALPEVFERRPDARGTFRFDDIPVRGRLYLITKGDRLAETQWRNDKDSFAGQPIKLTIERECILSGRVTLPDGSPSVGMEVSARRTSGAYLSTLRAVTDQTGKFLIRGLPEAQFVFSIEDPKKLWTFRPIEDLHTVVGNPRNLTLEMERGVLVSGRVLDQDGQPVEGAAFSAISDNRSDAGLSHDLTDGSGHYQFRLPTGAARLYFNALPDGFEYPDPQIVKHLEVGSGQADIEDLNFTISRRSDGPSVEQEAAGERTRSTSANHVAFPVSTSLHRSFLQAGVTAYAMVFANGVIENGKLNLDLLNEDALRRDLKNLAKTSNERIVVYVRYENWERLPEAEKQLEATVKKLCGEAGFANVTWGQQYAGEGWREKRNLAYKLGESGVSDDEPTMVDGYVRAYPVRTTFSRFLTDNADCVVDIRRPFDGRRDGLAASTVQSIIRVVDRLQPEAKESILFRISSTAAGTESADAFANPSSQSGGMVLARRLGFGGARVSHSPQGGSPETLIGKRPPPFTLDDLSGEPISIAEHIRNRAALITFWGLACGPCRFEAPHLSAAFQEYSDRGFTVIAVNAYDDAEKAVAEYVQKEQLRHPIVLNGSQVAREKYGVGAYPTSFWVDRQGKIVDYVIGYDPGDEIQIVKRIEQLLD